MPSSVREPIIIRSIDEELDYELELAVVSRSWKHFSTEQAPKYIGVCDFQR